MRPYERAFAVAAISTLLLPVSVTADAIVVTRAMLASTIAEVYVEDDAVRAESEIGTADFKAFPNVVPDQTYQRTGHTGGPFRDESVIYDALARSADGEVLTDVCLQTRRSLELKNQGGVRQGPGGRNAQHRS